MRAPRSAVALLSVWLLATSSLPSSAEPFLIIAHRGASGYLPEHTLEAAALAYGMGADYIEQDVVLTRDDQPIVLHDIHLDSVTDIARKFPTRGRQDGRYYALDFTLAEIRTLRVHERIDHRTGRRVYPGRFPAQRSHFQIPTLAEEIELIQGLNQSTGRQVGIYPEIKQPAWHHAQGRDISSVVLATLTRYGYTQRDSAIFLQCFEPQELKRLRHDLHTQVQLIQLISAQQKELLSVEGIREIASYADGIGPSLDLVFDRQGSADIDLVSRVHASKLLIHPYTFRTDQLPKGFPSFEQLLKKGLQAKLDGGFTDFPDRCAALLKFVDE